MTNSENPAAQLLTPLSSNHKRAVFGGSETLLSSLSLFGRCVILVQSHRGTRCHVPEYSSNDGKDALDTPLRLDFDHHMECPLGDKKVSSAFPSARGIILRAFPKVPFDEAIVTFLGIIQ
jgi:hypothetical protein